MKSIIYVGVDVHKNSYTMSSYTFENDKNFATTTVEAGTKNVLKYLERIGKDKEAEFQVGYEACCCGFVLYEELKKAGVDCVVMAPSTMPNRKNEIKTDKRDAMKIARCLATNSYRAVYVPTKEDLMVKEYVRMRDDHVENLKSIKQQILGFCLRHGLIFTEGKSYWTLKHLEWLEKLKIDAMLREVLDEYLLTYHKLKERLATFDKRIEEISKTERYAEKVKKLSCFLGIKTHTAMSLIVETGDFNRFAKAEQYAAYLGLVPSEHSSGEKERRGGITKAGNCHLRRLLIESAQSYGRGKVGYKSKALKSRQSGNSKEIIHYADRANERLRRRFYKMIFAGKAHNVAKTAVARELACFIWGMMTENTK